LSISLQKRLNSLVRGVLDRDDGAWLLWCDPRGIWTPLLRRVAGDSRMGGFSLLEITESTDGDTGSLKERRLLQERLDQNESLVVVVHASGSALGWMRAQALRAEQIYDRPLREQLLDWNWHPRNLTLSEAELGILAPHVGFILDYTSEMFHHELRRISSFGTLWEQWYTAPHAQWSAREMRGVDHTFSGLAKLIFPDGVMTKDDARLLLRHALEMRLRVRQQLNVMSPHEFPLTEFAYVDNETGDREIVAVE
jgi:hypothetical protein